MKKSVAEYPQRMQPPRLFACIIFLMENTPLQRFAESRNIWIATVRPDGRPHLTPVWCVVANEKIYVCVRHSTVKASNLESNPNVACSLEDGASPAICEGTASIADAPWPAAVVAGFKSKYGWDLGTDPEYNRLIEIIPVRWLTWK